MSIEAKPHWYMATDGQGGMRPYCPEMGPIQPHYINSLEKQVTYLKAVVARYEEALKECELSQDDHVNATAHTALDLSEGKAMSIEAEKGMCRHDARAVCWMCSDQQAWWRDARIKAGLGAEPPNGVVQNGTVVPAVTPARRRLRVMWRKWTRDSRSRRRAGAA